MTDLGRGYGSQSWNAEDPLYGGMPPQGGGPGGYGQQPSHGGYGQGQGQQQGWPADPYGQQQGGWQQPHPQQYPQQPYPPQYPQQPFPQQQPPPHQQQPPQHQQPPQQPRQPGPRPFPQQPQSGFDWEAEAAALEQPSGGPDPEDRWLDDEEPEEEPEGSFFGDQDDSRGAERRRKQQGKKSGRRNGGACLVVSVILVGILGGGGYYGYTFYQDHFGPPPDYSGTGTGSVQVEIPEGATGTQMGAALKQAGVVKSVDAFVKAYNANDKAPTIQAGFFTMHLQMSAAEAVRFLIDSAGGNVLRIPEGRRATEIYAMIDAKLKLDKGTTAAVAKQQTKALGLPAWAHGNIEGFLYPARYSIGKTTKPLSLLKQMVANANDEYTKLGINDAAAKRAGLDSGYQVLIDASIVQAEGFDSNDFGKVARVIYNRLHWQGQPHTLGMDSTLNYARGISTLNNSQADTRFKSPYNTYINPGLPPGPIGNPGEDALKAVLNPEPGDWHYFTTVKGHETRFEVTEAEHARDVQEFNRNQQGGTG